MSHRCQLLDSGTLKIGRDVDAAALTSSALLEAKKRLPRLEVGNVNPVCTFHVGDDTFELSQRTRASSTADSQRTAVERARLTPEQRAALIAAIANVIAEVLRTFLRPAQGEGGKHAPVPATDP